MQNSMAIFVYKAKQSATAEQSKRNTQKQANQIKSHFYSKKCRFCKEWRNSCNLLTSSLRRSGRSSRPRLFPFTHVCSQNRPKRKQTRAKINKHKKVFPRLFTKTPKMGTNTGKNKQNRENKTHAKTKSRCKLRKTTCNG